MFRIKPVQVPSLSEAVLITVAILFIMGSSIIIYDAPPHIPLAISLLLLVVYGLIKKVPYKDLEEGVTEGAKAGMAAVFLFFFIGILIASWMLGGTIPTLIYAGFELVTPSFYFAIVFVITAIVGMSVGSSLTTVGTVGVAFIGISSAIDASLAITAGAIVSGAFFGDKTSPLSDTTNMASSILKVDLFEHIKNMTWTTVPAFVITFILFAILSPKLTDTNFGKMEQFQQGLLDTDLVHWYNGVIPIVVLLIFSIMKAPALLALAAGSLSAIAISYINGATPVGDLFGVLFGGFVSETGVSEIDELLTRGGIEDMLFTIGLVLLALSMGGLLFTLGIVPRLLASIENMLKKVRSVILTSALTAIGINVLVGEQYLSILLTGESFQSQYKKVGLTNKNLARVSEDAGTVVNPLVPWSVTGVFITTVLGVPTLQYFPFAIFCLLCPLLTIFYGFTGKTLTYIDKEKEGAERNIHAENMAKRKMI
ncbi:Na+/H+ antiporter NhaC [Virgibacillus alimentarius]|uniref:Na+/H+ antiporter NhaC n=1 Tax=Virgibacillus alimentarius TaxID=698769 RepID=UPI00068EC4AA|nr:MULTISPECIES: Na+/H+ antiporter NhaC [Virgibacillus]HLR69255.1 Na+/H+ antiporter NhaC [Virgibacillus sp.]